MYFSPSTNQWPRLTFPSHKLANRHVLSHILKTLNFFCFTLHQDCCMYAETIKTCPFWGYTITLAITFNFTSHHSQSQRKTLALFTFLRRKDSRLHKICFFIVMILFHCQHKKNQNIYSTFTLCSPNKHHKSNQTLTLKITEQQLKVSK